MYQPGLLNLGRHIRRFLMGIINYADQINVDQTR